MQQPGRRDVERGGDAGGVMAPPIRGLSPG